MTPWTTHVKEFASKKGISYGCAASDPEVKKAYYSKKAADTLKDYKEIVKARKPKEQTAVGVFTTNYDDYYAIMDDGSVLSLLKKSKQPIILTKEDSVEDAWNWLRKNVRKLQYFNYTYNVLTSEDDPFIKRFNLKIGNPSTETKMLFYKGFAKKDPTFVRRLAEEKYKGL